MKKKKQTIDLKDVEEGASAFILGSKSLSGILSIGFFLLLGIFFNLKSVLITFFIINAVIFLYALFKFIKCMNKLKRNLLS